MYICNNRILEAVEPQVQNQPGLPRETLFQWNDTKKNNEGVY